jgi:adenine-specific DNA-methyltransferase
VASTYALLIGDEKRKALSAYFTPPALAAAALGAASELLGSLPSPRVLDPACGGGSFLGPVARNLVRNKIAVGASVREASAKTLKSIRGIEIDAGLAKLAEALLAQTLLREFGYDCRCAGTVTNADALSVEMSEKFDLVIGNPPYGRVRSKHSKARLARAGLANNGGHTNLYSLFLLQSLDWVKPGGGLVFVLPPSFVAGPYFAGLRQEIGRRADVIRIDLHEQRENLFLGAVQDICLLTLSVPSIPSNRHQDSRYQLGRIDADGNREDCGWGLMRSGGEPWTLPVATQVYAFQQKKPKGEPPRAYVLEDYGYRVRVGKVVPTRERDSLHVKRQKGDLPLLWASSIRPDGSFDFHASKRIGNAQWYAPGNASPFCFTVRPSLVVQRTSNRDQKRILNAAPVPNGFRDKFKKGFAAENHVIVIESLNKKTKVGTSVVAKLINSAVVNERFSAVSGSFSVSAKLLERLALPDPQDVQAIPAEEFEHGLRVLFSGLEILAPSKLARNPQDALDEPRDLAGGTAVDENARLKGRTAA